MTCLLTSAWHPFNSTTPWSPMNSDASSAYTGLDRQPSHGYASSGSESRRAGGSSGKKRASRAGTRSVTTLSAAQLERKRANDREAQRAIRQRTKDHIEHLERNVSDLRGSQESNEKLVLATQQRNRELEEENAYLRTRLNEAGYSMSLPQPETQRPPEQALLSAHSTSPATQTSASASGLQQPSVGTTSRSLSVATASQSSSSRHGSFQQQGGYLPATPGGPMSLPTPSAVSNNLNLTTWRSHDGTTNVPSLHPTIPQHAQEPSHAPPTAGYGQTQPPERVDWPAAPHSYQYPIKQEQPPQSYDSQQQHQQPPPQPPPGHQQHYVPAQLPAYTAAPPPTSIHAQTYHPPHLPPQTEFQNMAVSSPSTYPVVQHPTYQQTPQPQAYQPPPQTQTYQQGPQVQQYHQTPQTTYSQPSSYQMTPVQVQPPATGYGSPHGQMQSHGQMQPPPMSTAPYQPSSAEQQYPPQQHVHPPLQYREDPQGRSYAVTHYPSG